MRANHVYVGLKGSVLALDRESGRILWQRELAGSSFVNLIEDGDRIFALSHGEAYCLDAGTGALLWHNPLKGFGLGIGSILVSGQPGRSTGGAAAQIIAEQEAAAQHAATAPPPAIL